MAPFKTTTHRRDLPSQAEKIIIIRILDIEQQKNFIRKVFPPEIGYLTLLSFSIVETHHYLFNHFQKETPIENNQLSAKQRTISHSSISKLS